MANRGYRAALALAALAAIAFAGVTVMLVRGEGTAHVAAASRFTIEVNEQGFNPRVCIVSRTAGDSIVFKNVGTQVHRIVLNDIGAGNPVLFDEELIPGATSTARSYTSHSVEDFYDLNFPTHTMHLEAGFANGDRAANCAKEAPTPTPTPTRTATPIPTPTPVIPTPTAIQKPPRCIGLEGCGVAPQVSRD